MVCVHDVYECVMCAWECVMMCVCVCDVYICGVIMCYVCEHGMYSLVHAHECVMCVM